MEEANARSKGGRRRRAREVALALLYSLEFAGEDRQESKKALTASLIDKGGADNEYARELSEGVRREMAVIDEKIRSSSHHWRLERMSLIDRNIIRLGVYELMKRQVPVEVVIDEAVEIAKLYGDDKSASFVNGLLDAIAKKLAAAGRERNGSAQRRSGGRKREKGA